MVKKYKVSSHYWVLSLRAETRKMHTGEYTWWELDIMIEWSRFGRTHWLLLYKVRTIISTSSTEGCSSFRLFFQTTDQSHIFLLSHLCDVVTLRYNMYGTSHCLYIVSMKITYSHFINFLIFYCQCFSFSLNIDTELSPIIQKRKGGIKIIQVQ